MFVKRLAFCAVAIVFCQSSIAAASSIRYDFTGQVTSVFPGIEISDDQIAIGDSVSGFFAFQEFGSFEIEESVSPLPWEAELDGFLVASGAVPSNAADFVFLDNGPADILSLVHRDSFFLGGLGIYLEDPTGTAFDGVPLGTLDLAALSVARGWLEGSSGARIDFTLTSVRGASPIPEPSAFLVFGVGLIAAARFCSSGSEQGD